MSAPEDLAPLLAAARAWADADPEPADAAALRALAEQAGSDREAAGELADALAGLLEFGTAGLRGRLGPGPNRMNRAVVITAAAGLTAFLKERDPEPFVVIGFDARTGSDVFARDTAAVVTAAGGRAAVLDRALPTPVLAYAIRRLGADAGVMVTASHNPPQDNGYKVYLGDGAQITTPTDAEIAAQIARVGPAAQVPLADDGWETLDDDVWLSYVEDCAALLSPDTPREVTVVHTAMHGVGTETILAAYAAAGFPAPLTVAAQAAPDPAFPTVTFPNPEEPGAMDLALALAQQNAPDLLVANDPDADRCALGVAGPGGWRMLTGDETGALLGWWLLRRTSPQAAPDRVYANSIVSSRLLARIATAAGVRHTETLTGFKWIARVPGLRYGYEEALGYCCAPELVRDKDGVSAALLATELVAALKAEGRTALDVLDDLAREHGVHATGAFAIRVADLGLRDVILARLDAAALTTIAGVPVSRCDDLAGPGTGLPPTPGLRWYLADDSRVIVRPSGTEPKLKVYLEVVEPVGADGDLAASRDRAGERLEALTAAFADLTRP